jgi:oxaloacetate decarboxylase alpha subunit
LLKHQVPGGMISNLRYQLEKVGQSSRMPEVLEEAGRVRVDFGYPIMVTPLAQFVGVQASMNAITGKRYSVVSDEVIQYALGHWGKEAPSVMDPRVRDLILDRPRTEELRRPKPPPESLAQVRARFGAGVSDEELILRVYAADDADKIEQRGKPDGVLLGESPLVDLVSGLAAAKSYRHIVVRKGAAHVGVSRG